MGQTQLVSARYLFVCEGCGAQAEGEYRPNQWGTLNTHSYSNPTSMIDHNLILCGDCIASEKFSWAFER